jgi:hypothetical protein
VLDCFSHSTPQPDSVDGSPLPSGRPRAPTHRWLAMPTDLRGDVAEQWRSGRRNVADHCETLTGCGGTHGTEPCGCGDVTIGPITVAIDTRLRPKITRLPNGDGPNSPGTGSSATAPSRSALQRNASRIPRTRPTASTAGDAAVELRAELDARAAVAPTPPRQRGSPPAGTVHDPALSRCRRGHRERRGDPLGVQPPRLPEQAWIKGPRRHVGSTGNRT